MEEKIKTKEVDISNDDRPKLAKIGDYWTKEKIVDIINLLKEYQDVFARGYTNLKGLLQEMGQMKIELFPDTKLVKKRPYKLAHKYKEIVKTKIDNMVKDRIIHLVDQSEYESHMVIQPKKHDPRKLRICVDFIWTNKVTLADPFPTPLQMKSSMKLL